MKPVVIYARIASDRVFNTAPSGSDEITKENWDALVQEQLRIERISCFSEIMELRSLLNSKGIQNSDIPNWTERSDAALDKLLRYKLGVYGKLAQANALTLPYSWRRKLRTFYGK